MSKYSIKCTDSFEMKQFDLHLSLQPATAIGRNISRDLFQANQRKGSIRCVSAGSTPFFLTLCLPVRVRLT